MNLPRLSWNMDEDGVACVFATDDAGRMFPVLDVWRRPAIDRGGMTKRGGAGISGFCCRTHLCGVEPG